MSALVAGDVLRAIHTEYLRNHGTVSTAGLRDDWRPDELELMRWVDRYKRLCNRAFPSLGEILSLLLMCGYRRTAKNLLTPQILEDDEQEEFILRVMDRARKGRRQREARAVEPSA